MLHNLIIDAYYHGSIQEAHGPCCVRLDRDTGRYQVSIWDTDIDLSNVRPESLDFFTPTPRTHDDNCRCGGDHWHASELVPEGLYII